jgi:hypothetical protein
MNSSSRDVGHKGAGRPRVDVKRKHRALQFFDEEWELIRSRAEERGMIPREYLYELVERDGLSRTPDLGQDSRGITFFLRKDLADRLPKDATGLQAYINKAIEYKINVIKNALQASKVKSAAKAAASRENGKKGGRPKKNQEPPPRAALIHSALSKGSTD